ncbi:MAG: ribonuclease HII [Bacteroidia bacterium]
MQLQHNPDLLEAGLDEAGRGCLAGPVVAAAVILPQGFTHAWLTDSKQLSHKQRLALREEIIATALDWAVGMYSHGQIDEVNILRASHLAMHQAVENLSIRPEALLVDGNRFLPHAIPHTCMVKGDSRFLNIAAASILAKTYRDDIMDMLHAEHPEYGWQQNKGYPTEAHREAIRVHGQSPYHRRSFHVSHQLQLF